jgi:hypothetical protein
MKLEGLDSGLFRNFEGDATSCLHFFVEGANSTNLNGATYTGDTYSNMAGNSTSTEGYRDDIGPADASSKLRANNALTPRAYKPAAVGAIRSSNLLKHWYLSLVLLLSCGPACSQRFFHDHLFMAEQAADSGDLHVAVLYFDSAFARYTGGYEERISYASVLKRLGNEEGACRQLVFAADRHMHDYHDKLVDSIWIDWAQPALYDVFKKYADSTMAAHNARYNADYAAELLRMNVVDQGIRKIFGLFESTGMATDSVESLYWRYVLPIDSVNVDRFLRLYQRYGFPDIDRVGFEANKAGWLILQHAPLSVQKQLLPVLLKSCEQGQTPWKYYAYLSDRIITQSGVTETKYGCSGRKEADGIFWFRALNKSCLNNYRESVGLPPMDEYRQEQPCRP